MKQQRGFISHQQCFALLACLFLFMGIGRIFSLVTNNPILGYANNYDMIRLQACHQIWPADKLIDITVGTPSAPLRRYTLDKHVDTPCFPSSELLFTTIGIKLAELKNPITGEVLISIKTIGMVKAIFLSLTALFAGLYFWRKQLYTACLANALVMLFVLSDPGITLYLNTFYTEFSAVYFLYVTLIGVVIFAQSNYRMIASWVLLLGLIGLGFSKPQHAPLAFSIALLLSTYTLAKKQRFAAPVLLLCASLPFILQAAGWYTPRNASMIRTDNINFVGSMLGLSHQPEQILNDLALPNSCKALAGKTGYDPHLQKMHICPEVDNLPTFTAASALIRHPVLLAKITTRALIQQKNWVFDMYGQVERGRSESVTNYRRTLGDIISLMPDYLFLGILLSIALCGMLLAILIPQLTTKANTNAYHFLLLLIAVQAMVVMTTLLTNGVVGVSKSMHLYLPAVIATALIMMVGIVPTKKSPPLSK